MPLAEIHDLKQRFSELESHLKRYKRDEAHWMDDKRTIIVVIGGIAIVFLGIITLLLIYLQIGPSWALGVSVLLGVGQAFGSYIRGYLFRMGANNNRDDSDPRMLACAKLYKEFIVDYPIKVGQYALILDPDDGKVVVFDTYEAAARHANKHAKGRWYCRQFLGADPQPEEVDTFTCAEEYDSTAFLLCVSILLHLLFAISTLQLNDGKRHVAGHEFAVDDIMTCHHRNEP